jgi:DNA (cytosine-5)-methyltransferase 1
VIYGSLFTGIGGLDLGLDRAGLECAWQIEIDPTCRQLERHYPGVYRHDDIRTATARILRPRAGA